MGVVELSLVERPRQQEEQVPQKLQLSMKWRAQEAHLP